MKNKNIFILNIFVWQVEMSSGQVKKFVWSSSLTSGLEFLFGTLVFSTMTKH